MALLGPAGGLVYHWRALRHRRRLWSRFTTPLAGWLAEWTPPEPALLLVGPSAGWCLPAAFLARFATIDAIEPDPLARVLLARRFPGVAARVRWHARDPFASAAALAALGRDFPDHALLLANVLGQLRDVHPGRPWRAGLAPLLAGRSWASFHDRLSCALPLHLDDVSEPFPPTVRDEELLARFHAGPLPNVVEVDDHETADLFPDCPRRYLVWVLRPGRFHLIELVRSGG
ncbi:MAG: hypothetical protein U0807_12035 [Candidatus Binatia bacterium]